MTMQYTGYEVLPDEIAPARAPKRPERRCTRCGAVGTHYLTCARLRLPTGYRFSDDPEPEPVGPSSPDFRAAPRRAASGPDHPDWPRPPQR